MVVVSAGVYLGGSHYLDTAIRQRLTLLPTQSEVQWLGLSNVTFESISITPPRSFAFRNVRAGFKIPAGNQADGRLGSVLRMDSLVIRSTDMSFKDLEIIGSDFTIRPENEAAGDLGNQSGVTLATRTFGLDGKRFASRLSVDPKDPRPAVTEFLRELVSMAKTGIAKIPVELEGSAVFQFGGSLVNVPLVTVEKQGQSIFRLDRSALRKAAGAFEEKLGPTELEFLYANPMVAPVVLAAEEFAQSSAKLASKEDVTIPQRPYSRLLFGYFITRRLGSSFAEDLVQVRAKDTYDALQMSRDVSLGRQLANKMRSETELKEAARKGGSGGRGTAEFRVR